MRVFDGGTRRLALGRKSAVGRQRLFRRVHGWRVAAGFFPENAAGRPAKLPATGTPDAASLQTAPCARRASNAGRLRPADARAAFGSWMASRSWVRTRITTRNFVAEGNADSCASTVRPWCEAFRASGRHSQKSRIFLLISLDRFFIFRPSMKPAVIPARRVPPEAGNGGLGTGPNAAQGASRLMRRGPNGTSANRPAFRGAPHLDRRERQNDPSRGRRLSLAWRLSRVSVIGFRFSKRSQMTGATKVEKPLFSEGIEVFRCPRAMKSKSFFTKRSQMKGGSRHRMTRLGVGLCKAATGATESLHLARLVRVSPSQSDQIRVSPRKPGQIRLNATVCTPLKIANAQ